MVDCAVQYGTVHYCNLFVYCILSALSSKFFLCDGLISEELERLKQDPEIKHPEKHMLRTSRPAGLYQGCFSKSHWGNKRIKHKWDLFCKVAPKQAKRYAELPNHVRLVLGVDEMKHSNSKFKVVDGARQIPQPLVEALENLLMERIHLGEEVDNDFCTQVLLQLIEVWNSQVQELVSDVKTHVGPNLLKTQDSELGDEPTESQMEHAQREAERGMNHVLSVLRTCHVSENYLALRTLGCKMGVDVQSDGPPLTIIQYCTVQYLLLYSVALVLRHCMVYSMFS